MLIDNLPQFFAEYFQSYFGVSVYGNVDPNRNWEGKPTIEFSQGEQTTTTLINGGEIVDLPIVCACRAATADAARSMAISAKLKLFELLNDMAENGDIYSFSFNNLGTTADSRGFVEGESFYGFVEFMVNKKF